MERIMLTILCGLLFMSCSNDDTSDTLRFSTTDFPQTWELSHINTGLSGKIIGTEEAMIQETYLFRSDNTFTKKLEDEYVKGTAEGTFAVDSIQNSTILMLTYDFDVDSLSYCSNDNRETLYITEDAKVLANAYCTAFDGPGMYYERID